ncbi:MAG: RHS domain-containing protein [Deltaproteobacteria bacterium]|nr:RHS domain-containing protein [Deltaproteobacteria bacterium]
MGTISRKLFYLLAVLFIFSAISSPAYPSDQTIFGPKELKIKWWHIHLSFHKFNADDPGDGVITITKNTPNKKIRGGFVILNRRIIRLRKFLVGDDTVFEKDISLKSRNRLMVFLRGQRGASITIEVRKKSTIPPPEVTFSADPASIKLGESSTLTWTTTNADTVSIDQSVGSVEENGSLSVSPQQTTTYTLTATGEGGTTTESLTHLPPTVSIGADPGTIHIGESSTLTWTSTNADSCIIELNIGNVNPNGSTTVSPTETTTYTITATGPGGTATESFTVFFFAPTVTIRADPATIQVGDSATLTWTSTNADSVSIDQGIGSVELSGTTTVTPTVTTAYTITATGPGGTATDSAMVTVIAPPDDVDHGLDTDEQQGGGGLVGETIRVLNGNTIESRSDLQFPSPHRLGLFLQTTYNSCSDMLGSMGYGWTHTYEVSLDPGFVVGSNTYVKIVDQTGRAHYFEMAGAGLYAGVFNERSHVRAEAGGYVWYLLDGTKYAFSASGQLTWMDDAAGNRLELAYDTNDCLETVTDTSTGRALTLIYNVNNLMESISGPLTDAVPFPGIWVTYGYDDYENLISVTYADNSGFTYSYTDSHDIHNLTEKKNKSGHLLNTWAYDAQDRAIGNFSVDGKGVSIVYETGTQVNVTDAYGKLREYFLDEVSGRKRVTAVINGPGGAGGAPYSISNAVSWIYDESMRPIEVEYAGGTINQYQNYDTKGNPGTIRLAYTTPEERTITFTYHPDMNVPLTRTEPSVLGSGNKETIWDYDNDYDTIPNENPTALVCRIIEKGFTKDASNTIVSYEYITTFTYNSKGQVLSIDGPLPENGDTTFFTNDPTTGDLLSITRPLIGATSFSNYDAAGQVGLVTDVNNQSKSFTYDGRGRVTLITNNAGESSSSVIYTTAGLPATRTDEDGVISSFEYDSVYGRLSRRTDHAGNYISYFYDAQGNMIEKSFYDPSDSRTNWKRYLYQDPAHTMPGKLYKEINPDKSFTQYEYDLEGNVASVTDPNANTTSYAYDPLNRLITVTQPGTAVTSYTYDGHGNLKTVTDAESHTTTYLYDDMGRLLSTTSPDTGTVTYVYDEAGNPIQKTYAKGITVNYTYDTVKRLTATHFPEPNQDITYTYDTGAYGMGRLAGMTDPSGSITFSYNNRGRLIEKTSTINSHDFTLTHAYTPGNRLTAITYPTGRSVTYSRNSSGKIAGVSTTHNGDTTTLLNNLSYLPFGPSAGMDMGGSSVNNVFDELYRMTVANPGAETERSYGYDANGNITSINVTNQSWKNQNFTYDALNQLIETGGHYGTISYAYDQVGNRLERTVNDQTETYTYTSGTNKLDEIAGPNSATFAYDANGNTTGIGSRTFIYNQNNRLIRVEENGNILGEYTYNGLGQRVIKQADGVTTIFHYDLNGNLIAESLSDGTFTSEYIYMGNSRLAKVNTSDNATYYYLNDHLGTPQIMTDSNGTVVWEASYRPFGDAEVNPSSSVVNNFRLPGQYFDKETGFHYNYFRDYHPRIGGYVEPDQIGLRGGINMYAYCMNNPVNLADPSGQFGLAGAAIGAISGGIAGFVAGAQAGNIWAGVVGGAAGGIVGGIAGGVGAFGFSPKVGAIVGGIVGGIFGGASSGLITKKLEDPNASTEEKLWATGKGAGIGLVTGTILGTVGAAGLSIGATGYSVNLAGAVIATPIACVLGVFSNLLIGPDQEADLTPSLWPPEIIYPPDWFPEFQYNPNNPEDIDRNSTVEISVIGGTPPYTWSVSGKGFSLAETETQGLSNTLYADDTACRAATITVIDDCGQTATGYVRCTTGQWVLKGHYCGLSGSVPNFYACGKH